MKKPELNDYDLKKEDFEKLDKQEQNYKKAISQLCQEYDEYNIRINWIAAIPSIIIAIPTLFLWYRLNNYEEGSTLTVLLLLASIIIYPIVICKFFKKDYLNDTRCERNKYVDKNLENRIERFKKDFYVYEDYCEKLNTSYWKNLSGYQFEHEVANLYKKQGYSATVTKATGDGGIDIILKKDNQKIAVQCKHHSSKVGPNDVRALIGSIALDSDYTSGIFVSLNGFTPTVAEEIKKSKIKIELISLKDLLELAK